MHSGLPCSFTLSSLVLGSNADVTALVLVHGVDVYGVVVVAELSEYQMLPEHILDRLLRDISILQ